MFLGELSVTLLRAFWDGYGYAARAHRPLDNPTPTLDRFSRWLSMEWAGFPQTYRWEKVLLFAHSSEPNALEQFFVTFDQFCAAESASAAPHPAPHDPDVAVAS